MKLRLVHVHLPDGTVTQPMPYGRVISMLEAGEITAETKICNTGTEAWVSLGSDLAASSAMTTHKAVTTTPPAPPSPVQDLGAPLSDRLTKARNIFLLLALLNGGLLALLGDTRLIIAGVAAWLSPAIITAVFAQVMQGRP